MDRKTKQRTIGTKKNLEPKYVGYTVSILARKYHMVIHTLCNITRQYAVNEIIENEAKGYKCFLYRGDPRDNNIEYRSPV